MANLLVGGVIVMPVDEFAELSPFAEDMTNHYAALGRKARGKSWVVRGTVIYDEHGHEVARCQKHDEARLIVEYCNTFPLALRYIGILQARVKYFSHQVGRFRLITRIFHIRVPQSVIESSAPLLTSEEGIRLHQSAKRGIDTRHRRVGNGLWRHKRVGWDCVPPFTREEADAILARAEAIAEERYIDTGGEGFIKE